MAHIERSSVESRGAHSCPLCKTITYMDTSELGQLRNALIDVSECDDHGQAVAIAYAALAPIEGPANG